MMQSTLSKLPRLARHSASVGLKAAALIVSRRAAAAAAAVPAASDVNRARQPASHDGLAGLIYPPNVSDMVASTGLEQNFTDSGFPCEVTEAGVTMQYAGVTVYGFGLPTGDLAKDLRYHVVVPPLGNHFSTSARTFSSSAALAEAARQIHSPPPQPGSQAQDPSPWMHRPSVSEMVHGTSLEQNFSDPGVPPGFFESGHTMQYAGVTIHGYGKSREDPVKPASSPTTVPSRSKQFSADSPIDDVF